MMYLTNIGYYRVKVCLIKTHLSTFTGDWAESFAHEKIKQIKAIRAFLGIGLKEAKDLCEYIHKCDDDSLVMALSPDRLAALAYHAQDADFISYHIMSAVERHETTSANVRTEYL